MKHRDLEPTIAAIATAPGAGGIGIIRISGNKAPDILQHLFRPLRQRSNPVSHKMYYGWITDPVSGAVIDEVLAVTMLSPHTYTREDLVEIHCHGSYLVLQHILALVLGLGATLAAPGEFTKRAFLNGRIDLTRAEAVLDLLTAKTKEGLNLAMNQLQGDLYNQVEKIRDALLAMLAIVEVAIDFPEDDVDIIEPAGLRQRLQQEVEKPLTTLLASAQRGKIFRDGISAVILGRPNVGKSSLLNSLLREERAIVTSQPGTTRDTIEEYLDIKGMPLRIIDTAGIRTARGAIEEIGIRRTKEKVAAADLVLLLLDGSAPPNDEDRALYDSIAGKPAILVLNKTDLAPNLAPAPFGLAFPGLPLVLISAKMGTGLKDLEDTIFTAASGDSDIAEPSHNCAPNIRHQAALTQALATARRASAGLHRGLPADLLAVELQTALGYLGDIVGLSTTDDVLDLIFEQFCIGK